MNPSFPDITNYAKGSRLVSEVVTKLIPKALNTYYPGTSFLYTVEKSCLIYRNTNLEIKFHANKLITITNFALKRRNVMVTKIDEMELWIELRRVVDVYFTLGERGYN